MQHQPTILDIRRIAQGLLAVTLTLAALGCGNKFKAERPEYREAGSPKFALGDPTITHLGKLEGPFMYIKSLSPSIVQIANPQGKMEAVKLVGLSDEIYPEPTPDPAAKDTKPEDPAVKERRRNEIKAFKMEAHKGIFGSNQLFLIRLTQKAPSVVYIMMPDTVQIPGKKMTGEGSLANALALRRGLATLELIARGATNHPLFNYMLDSQLASFVEYKRKGLGSASADLWGKFQITLPNNAFITNRLSEIESKM